MKIFTLLILLLLLPVSAWAEATKESVSYIECSWNGSEVTSSTKTATATVVTAGVTEWGENNGQEHWYVVNGEINIPTRVTVTGKVHLILADGCKLTASNGIQVSKGYSLTIYAQSEGDDMGVLEATEYNNDAAGYDNDAAGIGGSVINANSGTVTIHGGTVNATSDSGAGIGGGGGVLSFGSDGTVTIYGGEVTAISTNGAGIGGGGGVISGGSDGTVTIYGGEVTAISSIGAGIGGGGGNVSGSSGSTVTIHGGTVTATSNSGAGIGGGGGNVSSGSGSFSTGTNGNAFIIASSIQDKSNKGSWSGVLFEGDAGAVYGSPTLQTDATIPADKTLTIENGKTLTIGEGVTLTVEEGATLANKGKIINYGTINGTVTGNGTVAIPLPLTEDMIAVADATYTYTGVEVTPVVTVGKEDVIYTEDTDYTVSYSDNINAGTAKVTVTPIDGSLLLGDAVTKEFTIEKATPTITLTVPTGDDLVYDGKAKEATATVNGVANETEVLTATVTYYSDDTYQTEVEETKDAGTYYVKATFVETANYVAAEETASFTIAKASATLSFAKKEVLAVMGETVENTLNVTPAGVAVLYSSSANGVATVDASGVITLVGAGTTTITATVDDPNYQGEAAYTLTVTLAPLGEGEITAEGETNISIEMDGTSFELTAKVIADDLGTNGTWTWASGNTNVATVSVKGDAASGYSLRATTDPKTSTAIVTPVAAGTATITATYTDSEYTGSVDFTVTITEPEPEEPKPPIYQPSYYNIYVEDVCEGVDITTSKNVVREGGTISLYVEKDTANYTFDNFQVYYKRSYYGPWEVLEEGVQPGEYPINNIWTHIYVKAEGAEEKEDDPTGMEQVEGVKVYTKDGSLYVQTPQRETVIIVSMTGAVVKSEEQIGLKQYHGLQPGIYIVRIGERAYKVRLN